MPIYNPTDNTWSYCSVEKSTDVVRRGIGAIRFETPKRDPNAPYEDLDGNNYRRDRLEIRNIENASLTAFYEEDIYTGFSIYIPTETGTVSGPTDVTSVPWNFIHQQIANPLCP